MLIRDQPKPELKPKPKYRSFGFSLKDTETKTERQSIQKLKPKEKPIFFLSRGGWSYA
jgi:hypothetical protein